ncbi:MAG: hypothetical protein HY774_24325 [Acidobacteria bacterium]|nr:hypothetical protein [Acidobacteriota bacterium]
MIWLVTIAFIGLMFGALIYDYQRKQARSIEEYETEIKEGENTGTSLMRAGLLELDKLTKPNLQAAIEFAKDAEEGQTDNQKESGEGADETSK